MCEEDSSNEPRETTLVRLVTCCGWLMVSSLVAVIAYVVIDGWCLQSVARETIDEGRRLLRVQMDQLTRGEINCLCQPDPALLSELLADAACAGHVRDVRAGAAGACSSVLRHERRSCQRVADGFVGPQRIVPERRCDEQSGV